MWATYILTYGVFEVKLMLILRKTSSQLRKTLFHKRFMRFGGHTFLGARVIKRITVQNFLITPLLSRLRYLLIFEPLAQSYLKTNSRCSILAERFCSDICIIQFDTHSANCAFRGVDFGTTLSREGTSTGRQIKKSFVASFRGPRARTQLL